jgi:hypothetical protein
MANKTKYTGVFFQKLKSTQGSTLSWTLMVILVILIVFGAALLAIQTQLNIVTEEHEEQQAYYTALSTLDTVSHWIAGSNEEGAAAA